MIHAFKRIVSVVFFLAMLSVTLQVYSADVLGNDLPAAVMVMDISEDTEWDTSGSPYRVNDTITILDGATLTVSSGVEVLMGQGSGMIIEGTLKIGDELGNVSVGPESQVMPGFWKGISIENGGKVYLDRTIIDGADTVFECNSSIVEARNSTIGGYKNLSIMNNGSDLLLSNTSFDPDSIVFLDNASRVRSFALVEISIIDRFGDPKGDLDMKLVNSTGDIVGEYFLTSTGKIPFDLFRGYTYYANRTDMATGTYDIVISDVPFTHFNNKTLMVNGSKKEEKIFRFSWPPEMTNIPERLFTYEDRIKVIYSEILDRNKMGAVDLNISSTNVFYDPVYSELSFLYEDESITNETVYLNLSDGIDMRVYSIDVEVVHRDDPPVFKVPFTLVYVTEDEPYVFNIDFYDEDTSDGDLVFDSSDPENVTFDIENSSFIFDYGDGTPSEFNITLTVSDGTSRINRTVTVFFKPVFYPPYFSGPLPTVVLDEDSWVTVDLEPYIRDPDAGEDVRLEIRVDNYDLFTAAQNGTVLNISSMRDMHGSGSIDLLLVDDRGLTGSGNLDVIILPINDPPLLIQPSAVEIEPGRVRFNVTFVDIDGDEPWYVALSIDGFTYNMSRGPLYTDTTKGVRFHLTLKLARGNHTYAFRCSDGDVEITTEEFIIYVEEPLNTLYLEDYNGWLNITFLHRDEMDAGMTLVDPIMPGDKINEITFVSFRLDSDGGNIDSILVMIWVNRIDPKVLGEYSNVILFDGTDTTEVLGLSYDRSKQILSFQLPVDSIGKEVHITSLIDPEYDSDQDGYPDVVDDFPLDPSEWLDTDGDGIGNNADTDDDGDGFPDLIELEAGTDPLSASDYPRDTDGDGILDYLDDDDDGDGIPDEWEIRYGLDPLDPEDALLDYDNDGISNLQEYLDGTDPYGDLLASDVKEPVIPMWLIILISVILIILIITGSLIFFVSARDMHKKADIDAGAEWSIREELDPDDAVECTECSSVYPFSYDDCPFCGESNPYNEEM